MFINIVSPLYNYITCLDVHDNLGTYTYSDIQKQSPKTLPLFNWRQLTRMWSNVDPLPGETVGAKTRLVRQSRIYTEYVNGGWLFNFIMY